VISSGEGRGVSDSRSNSETGVDVKQPKIATQALLRYSSKSFFSISQKKENYPGEPYKRFVGGPEKCHK